MVNKVSVGIVVCAAAWCCATGVALASFGFSSVSFSATEAPSVEQAERGELGAPDTRAGSHPWAVTAKFELNTTPDQSGHLVPDGDLKDIFVELPPGLIGNATALPECSIKQFETKAPVQHEESTYFNSGASCAPNTQVGYTDVRLSHRGILGNLFFDTYNLVPPPGTPAQFGINPFKIPVILRPTVRSGGDYGLTVAARNISQFERIGASTVTFWGVPGDASHDALRGECLGAEGFEEGELAQTTPEMTEPNRECGFGSSAEPFLTMPTSCSGPLTVTFLADSWEHPGSFNADGSPNLGDPNWVSTPAQMPAMSGCEKPAFAPTLTASPDTTAADTPAGLTVDLKMNQDGLLNPTGIAPATIQNATVKLPVGMVVNPGQAAGLVACQSGETGLGSQLAPSCPAASRVGTVQITSPLLADKLEGDVYILQSNPPNLQLLVSASADGVNVKLLAEVSLDETSGQLTTRIIGAPPLPVSDFKLIFSGGAQAALATPSKCGIYTTESDFLPWSAPFSPDLLSTNSFAVQTGPGGTACASPLPFSPVLSAGGTSDQAGGYTNFSLLLQRGDGQQRVSGLSFKTPEGLSGMISGVPLCPEPQASQGTCSAASQIGHTLVTAGPGPAPLVVPEPGRPAAPIYLTGPYRGAPYGLSIAVPVLTGPFDLGTQVVRATIAVDPHTAQLTITTDPSGPYAIPTILHGIPTDLRSINAVIDRPGFMFDPTNCNPMAFTGTATSSEGATAAVSSRFQVGGCRSLAFKPGFKVSTSGRTSRKNGASLNATITYPSVAAGTNQASAQANIASVKVDLPKQLPSRLTTLQKACLAVVFEANPAGCPSASLVGRATVHTPILPVPLTGPAYFVSHGGEAFPSLIIVLQGYGVTVDLVGTTFISKAGITSSTFKSVPDVPFTSFALTLPQGPFSALTANGNLCKSKLAMPTAFNGQNGAVIHQSTPIAVTNCPKVKQKSKAKQADAARQANRNGRMN